MRYFLVFNGRNGCAERATVLFLRKMVVLLYIIVWIASVTVTYSVFTFKIAKFHPQGSEINLNLQ